jgi:hypothetical protein
MRWYDPRARLIRGERIIPDDFRWALRHMPSVGLAVLGVQRGDSRVKPERYDLSVKRQRLRLNRRAIEVYE